MSQLSDTVRRFYELGYTPENGGVLRGPSGKQLSLTVDRSSRKSKGLYAYWQTRDRETGLQPRIYYHKLVAYHLYGEAAFADGVVIRHLDGNSLNNNFENIAIGSAKDNWMDIPATIRQRISDAGGVASRKLSAERLAEFKSDREAGMSYKKLMAKYGLSKSTVSYIVNGKTYK